MQIAMVIVQFFVGLFSLFIDPKDKTKRGLLIVLITLLLISAGGACYIALQEDTKHQAELTEERKDRNDLKESNKRLEGYLVTIMQRFGSTKLQPSQDDITQSIEADKGLRGLQTSSQTSRGITVEYFRKDFDAEIVGQELEKLGFSYRVKPPVNQIPTNAIWVGDNITLQDAQKVALILVRVGVQLRSLNRFHSGAGQKSLLIQVGADPGITSWPILSASDVLSMRQLKRFPT